MQQLVNLGLLPESANIWLAAAAPTPSPLPGRCCRGHGVESVALLLVAIEHIWWQCLQSLLEGLGVSLVERREEGASCSPHFYCSYHHQLQSAACLCNTD